jgi:hypothetical protein
MRPRLLGGLIALGLVGGHLAQAATLDENSGQLCAPRQIWTSAAAAACIASSYRQGAEAGMWRLYPAFRSNNP